MNYEISVVVPVYKVRDRIIRTLESLKAQTFKDFEVLFVDDGSPDDSSDFADNYLKDSDVAYKIIKKKNGGVSSARNLGIEEAKGEYIMFLDSDDYIDKNMLKGFYDKILEGNFDVLYCAYVFEESNEKEITNNMKDLNYGEVSGKEAALGLIYGTTYTHIMANLFKRSLLINNNIRFDEKRKFAEDISFMVKAYASSERVYCINKIYAHYVKWGESAMNNINLNYKDVYYSNVETLQYIKEKFNDKALEKAMVTSRIPAAIVNIFIGFATKKELHDDMYEFINDETVRKDLRRYKMYKLEKDRLKYLILSKVILLKPSIIENYYGKRS
ncbi:glycosyltransferase family 2 protein [Clostridium butyricum]|uniref:glycosyltransferase family 2 protein n=1 Tax=Clostridium TaxID=1485 RepID=UPI0002CBA64A|nr:MULTISPECIES: glycosyltransferase family 2 protein [Clostridium]ALP91548.1 glycosyl transferase family 2 [Clostridium butyricum]ALS18044.1 glycosyl transferase family 2 [Clostridium butyricum]ANF15169.1 glycosyl transferase family 2 [Clostridium butyricum]EMU55759.1 glycosyl transferase, family 2 [Clostridium butyricum DKU-01]MBS4842251.1 glycosyltransferase family 2 protein [Clostridium sp.]